MDFVYKSNICWIYGFIIEDQPIGTERAWVRDEANNAQPIDEHVPSIPENMETANDLTNATTLDLSSGIDTEEAMATTTDAALEGLSFSAAGPLAAAWAISKTIGEGVSNMEYQSSLNDLTTQTINNMSTPGLTTLNAEKISQWNSTQLTTQKSYADIGANFGLLGEIIGRAVGSPQQIPQSMLNTAYSQDGRIDPFSDSVNISQDSGSIPSYEMGSDGQTSEDSNALDISI